MKSRQKTILAATIERYVQTAEPVGSNALAQRQDIDVSPATIRSDLNALEDAGYLTQVHTSSGRVPTDQGYREYVDSLMVASGHTGLASATLTELFQSIGENLSTLLNEVTDTLSKVVDYTTIVVTPDIFRESLKAIHMVLVDIDKVLVVLLNSVGVNQEFLVELGDQIAQDDLNKISNLLTQKLEGRSVYSLNEDMVVELVAQIPAITGVVRSLNSALARLQENQSQNRKLMTSGKAKMLRLPEFSNISLARKVFEALEEERVLLDLVNAYLNESSTNVVIGQENEMAQFQECSVVLAPIKLGQSGNGAVGLVGPTRMAYSQILPLVQSVSNQITTLLSEGETS